MVVRVRVDNTAIQSMFEPGGEPYGRMRTAAALGKDFARGKVNRRTGLLQATIFYRTRVRRYACGFDLGAGAYYANWVNDGTTGPIFPTHSKVLMVPRSKFSLQKRPRPFVRGQSAQHFLEYGAIHGLQAAGLPVPFSLHF